MKLCPEYLCLYLLLAALSVAFTQLNQYPFQESDLVAYHTAEKLFFEGGNPYDTKSMEQRQAAYGRTDTPKMVWNPPTVFVTLGLATLPAPHISRILQAMLLPLAALYIVHFGRSLRGAGHRPSAVLLALPVCCSIPFLSELWILQMSSIITAIALLGITCCLRGQEIRGGIFLSVLILKPYLLFLPATLLLLDSVRRKRWRIWAGLGIGILVPLLAAEEIHPGILRQWIYRESWPPPFFGATLASFIRAFFLTRTGNDPYFLVPVFSALGVLFIAAAYMRRGLSSSLIMTAMALSPLVAPYGFFHDQGSAIAVQSFILEDASRRGKSLLRFASGILGAGVLAGFLLMEASIFQLPAPWLLPSLLTVFLLIAVNPADPASHGGTGPDQEQSAAE